VTGEQKRREKELKKDEPGEETKKGKKGKK
jgi:hypothetical protein